MKRLIVSFCIILALGGFSLYGTSVVKAEGRRLTDMLDDAISYAESDDMETARKRAKDIENRYIEAEKRLSFFVDHTAIGDIGVDISQLYYLADEEGKSDFCALCRSTKIAVTHIVDGETPSLRNIF